MRNTQSTTHGRAWLRAAAFAILAIFTCTAYAQEPPSEPPPPLKKNASKNLPDINWLNKFQKNNSTGPSFMLMLGKALFWDQQVGSDGQACASCHSHAGADLRSKNQLNPGHLGNDFDFDPSNNGVGGANYQLTAGDFPFHEKVDKGNRDEGSNIAFNTNDVASSMGTFGDTFDSVDPITHTILDNCTPNSDFPEFEGNRRVEPRHTPTVINAALNFDNFWDGRANNIFNGGVLGLREAVTLFHLKNGAVESGELKDLVNMRIDNASLASQAVGPIESQFEMSCAGRDAADIGEKLMDKQPLHFQDVHPKDLAFKYHFDSHGKIDGTYRSFIKGAFKNEWWDSDDPVSLNEREYEMIEANFPLFFGISVMIYERTLISNKSKYDLVHRGQGPTFTAAESNGQDIFVDKGKCVNCHATAAFTKASTLHLIDENEEEGLVERMIMGDQNASNPALYDNGWYNISVSRTNEDISRGADMFGDPLSFTLQYIEMLRGKNVPDPFEIDECKFEVRFDGTVFPGILDPIQCDDGSSTLKPQLPLAMGDPQDNAIKDMRTAVDGAQKVPILRNLSVTGPYTHNGGKSDLQQVIQFYNRGGDFFATNQDDVDPDIVPLGLSDGEKQDLEAFLRTLDDPRVLNEQGPFARPQLFLPVDGAVTGQQLEDCMNGGSCAGIVVQPAIGKRGRSREGLPPLGEFADMLLP